jgi:hypothetical protein
MRTRLRSAADEAGAMLRESLPLKTDVVSTAARAVATSRVGVADQFAAVIQRMRSAADEAGALLRGSLPLKAVAASSAARAVATSRASLGDRFAVAFQRVRLAADEAGALLRGSLPLKADEVSAASRAVATPRVSVADRFVMAIRRARLAVAKAEAVLRESLPLKSDAGHAGAFRTSATGANIADRFAEAVARARVLANNASVMLRDSLPLKRDPTLGTFASSSASDAVSHASFGDRIAAAHSRARLAAAEARAVLRDCLPVQAAPRRALRVRQVASARRRPLPLLRFPSVEQVEAAAMLFMPFVLLTAAVIFTQIFRREPRLVEITATPYAAHELRQARPDAQRLADEPLSAVRALEDSSAIRPVASSDEVSAETPPPAAVGATQPAEALSPAGSSPSQIAMLELPDIDDLNAGGAARGICVKTASLSATRSGRSPTSLAPTPEAFGVELAKAAEAQADGFVIYNDKYRSISYPMGDVPSLFGVCTDVVVRAYRALGLDLQTLVHEARSGSGDRNIDHRRTEVLRRFFAARGENLPITAFAEDYLPGDIVTYYRPQNRRNRSHIAVVSTVVAPSGRPMIIHNRGWGPQLEDALFVDQITGHYRYYGPSLKPDVEKASAGEASTHADGNAKSGPGSAVMPVAFAPRNRSARR